METTRRRLEFTLSCSFDNIANAIESSLYTFEERGESDSNSAKDDNKVLTRGDLRGTTAINGPLYVNKDARRPLIRNNLVQYKPDIRRPLTLNQARPANPMAIANLTTSYPAYPCNITCHNYLNKGYILRDYPHLHNEE
jgi:hypothetical protein